MNSTRTGSTAMNVKYLTLAAVVTVWASAAVAAINFGHPEPVNTRKAENTAIPRVVVTAKRAEDTVARVVVVARRAEANLVLATR